MNITEISEGNITKHYKMICNIFHPYVILPLVMLTVSYHVTKNFFMSIIWTIAGFLPAIALPLLYAKFRAVKTARRLDLKISRTLIRDNPKQLLITTALFSIPSILILYYLDSPKPLLTVMICCSAVMFTISLLNFIFRASFHVSLVTSMFTILYLNQGPWYLATFILIPFLGFARYKAKEHTPHQIIVGFIAGLVISILIYLFSGINR